MACAAGWVLASLARPVAAATGWPGGAAKPAAAATEPLVAAAEQATRSDRGRRAREFIAQLNVDRRI
jgi:hypothetical protein